MHTVPLCYMDCLLVNQLSQKPYSAYYLAFLHNYSHKFHDQETDFYSHDIHHIEIVYKHQFYNHMSIEHSNLYNFRNQMVGRSRILRINYTGGKS